MELDGEFAGSLFSRFVQDHPDVLGQLPPYIHEAIVRADGLRAWLTRVTV